MLSLFYTKKQKQTKKKTRYWDAVNIRRAIPWYNFWSEHQFSCLYTCNSYCTLGVKEFIPSVKRPPDITVHAQFQNFEEVMTKFTKWLPHQTVSGKILWFTWNKFMICSYKFNELKCLDAFQAIRMVNIQSFDVRYKEEMGKMSLLAEFWYSYVMFRYQFLFLFVSVHHNRWSRDPFWTNRRHWRWNDRPFISQYTPGILRDGTQSSTPTTNQLHHFQVISPSPDRREIFRIDVTDNVSYWSLAESHWYNFVTFKLQSVVFEFRTERVFNMDCNQIEIVYIRISFLKTGIPVYSVETVRFLYREPLKLGVDDTRTNYTSFKGVGKYYVTAVR